MKFSKWLIIIAIAVIAAITNPDKIKHEEAVKDEVRALVLNTSGNSDIENLFEGVLAGVLLDAYIGQAVSVDNYLLFSLTRMEFNDKSKIVGIGIFGNNIVSINRDDLIVSLNKQ